ncbi:hypothetical protein F5888DRAFT_1636789 [Russula emetica]|nr:hypothetical protein F5888DRAFT_1636789 [Russula emetica]
MSDVRFKRELMWKLRNEVALSVTDWTAVFGIRNLQNTVGHDQAALSNVHGSPRVAVVVTRLGDEIQMTPATLPTTGPTPATRANSNARAAPPTTDVYSNPFPLELAYPIQFSFTSRTSRVATGAASTKSKTTSKKELETNPVKAVDTAASVIDGSLG